MEKRMHWGNIFGVFFGYLAIEFILTFLFIFGKTIILIQSGTPFESIDLKSIKIPFDLILLIESILFFLFIYFIKPLREFVKDEFCITSAKRLKNWGILFIGILILFTSNFVVLNSLTLESPDNPVMPSGDIKGIKLLLYFVVVAILSPIKEEIIFRGFIFGVLKEYQKPWIGFILSSLVFGIMHPYPIAATLMGVGLGFVYHKTKSLSMSIALHVIWNTIAFIGSL
jgi:hypothetical protein